MTALKPSATRVWENTSPEINRRIQEETERSIAYYQARPEKIGDRLHELNREWDIERALETASAGLSLGGLLLGTTVSRKWLLLPLIVQGFFLQHALQGWCPPLPMLRRMGFRTTEEIDRERFALRMLRGDLDEMYHQQLTRKEHSHART